MSANWEPAERGTRALDHGGPRKARCVIDAEEMAIEPACSRSDDASPKVIRSTVPADPPRQTGRPSIRTELPAGVLESAQLVATPSKEFLLMKSPFTSPPGTGAVTRKPPPSAWTVRRPSLITM